MPIKKCLILGGAGFLGRNLCKELSRQGYEITVYNRESTQITELCKIVPSVRIIKGDFSTQTKESFGLLLSNIDVVFHLISTTNPSNKNVLYDFESNVLPTIRFLDACIKSNIKKFIYFSSGGTVYGLPKYVPIDEIHQMEPISSYGIHKLSIEKCIEYYGRTYQLDYNILRIANPYGRGQRPFVNQGVIAVFLANALLGKTIEVWGDGKVVRDYISVVDVIMVCIKVIDYQGQYKIFNVGSGKGSSLNEIIDIIQGEINKTINVKYVEGRIQDVSANILDISLIENELNWTPKVTLEQGIGEMISNWDSVGNKFKL